MHLSKCNSFHYTQQWENGVVGWTKDWDLHNELQLNIITYKTENTQNGMQSNLSCYCELQFLEGEVQ